MSQPVLSILRGRSSAIFRHAVLAVALCGSAQVATASTTVDQLSNCLVGQRQQQIKPLCCSGRLRHWLHILI